MANMLSWLTGREDQTGQPSPVKYDDGQPSLRAYNPTPSERVGNWIQDLLMAGGAQAYPAGHVAHGVRDLLSMSPLGIGMSAADLLHAKNAGDPMGAAAAAAIGMVPGLKPEVQAIRQGIRAYHGSPHDFDKFDLSKIGTGEGAQAYGHGLYFAESEGVARSYRDMLASGDFKYTGQELTKDKLDQLHANAATINEKHAVRKLDDMINLYGYSTEKALSHIDPETKIHLFGDEMKHPGKMYEVNINAKPEQFLDWDRSLREQPQVVQDMTKDLYSRRMPSKDPNELPRAGDAYQRLGNYTTPREVSQNFAEAGIPGIRYLDHGSRASPFRVYQEGEKHYVSSPSLLREAGPFATREEAQTAKNAKDEATASRNYVLFNDQLIDIMRKYGLAGAAATGTAASALQPQDASAAKAQPAQFQQPAPLSDKINQIIDSLQWQDQWQGRMRLPLQQKVNNMLGESVWPPLH